MSPTLPLPVNAFVTPDIIANNGVHDDATVNGVSTPEVIVERTAEDDAKAEEGLEPDGGGRLGDAMALIKACLQLDVARRPSFERIMSSRYLSGAQGWVDLADIVDVEGEEVEVASRRTSEESGRTSGEWT